MTIKSRIMAMLVCVIMLMQSMGVMGATAVKDEVAEPVNYDFSVNALRLMVDLGVIDAGTDAEYAEKVTKAEFAEMICKLLGVHDELKDSKVAPYYIKDVSETYWASPFVQYVISNSFMKLDDGDFQPEKLVNVEIVASTMLNILGRGYFTNVSQGIVSDEYFSKVTRGIKGSLTDELMLGEVMKMLHNSVNLNIYEQVSFSKFSKIEEKIGVTILSKYRDIYRVYGVVTGNKFTHINDASFVSKGKVKIDDVVYYEGTTRSGDALGSYGEFYYKQLKNEEDKTLISMLENSKNKVTQVISSDISPLTTNKEIHYFEGSGTTKVDLSPNANIIMNNKFVGRALNIPSEKFNIANGEMVLIDNNNDGNIDLVKINTYKLGVISSVNLDKETVSFKFGISFVELDGKSYSIYKDGEVIDTKSLAPWDVTEVYESDDKSAYVINVITTKVSGEVAGIEEVAIKGTNQTRVSAVTIGDIDYKLSNVFESETGSKIKVGIKGTFTVDTYGQFAFLRSSGASGENYGYVVGYEQSAGLSRIYKIKIFTAGGEMEIYEINKKVTVDGVSGRTGEQLESALKSVAESVGGVNSIVKYIVNEDKKIVSVDTITQNGIEHSKDELTKTVLSGKMRYTSMGMMLVSEAHNRRAVVGNNTVVFLIPDQPQSDSDYMVNNVKYFVNAQYYENMEIYDVEKNVVSVIKQKMVKKSGSYGNIDASQSPLAIITRVSTILSSEGDECTKLTVFINNSESSVEIVEKTDIVQASKTGGVKPDLLKPSDLHIGDFIYYEADLKNRANTIVKLNELPMDKEAYHIIERGTYNERAYGWLKDRNEGILEMNVGEEETVLYNIATRNPKIYAYSTSKKTVRVATRDELVTGDTANSATKLYIRVRFGEIREIIIFE